MSNPSRRNVVRRMLAQGFFTAVLGISVGCGASVASLPTGPTPAPVTVAKPDIRGYTVIAAMNTVDRGDQISVSWTAGIPFVGDSISLANVGGAGGTVWTRPTEGAASGNFTATAPKEPGQYEFRYLYEDLGVAARSSLVTVR